MTKFWQRIAPDEKQAQCYFTIYSKERVVDKTVDTYLDTETAFDALVQSRKSGQHNVYVSENLQHATDQLISLKKLGELGEQNPIDGAACHLRANLSPTDLQTFLRDERDFRAHLREVDGTEHDLCGIHLNKCKR